MSIAAVIAIVVAGYLAIGVVISFQIRRRLVADRRVSAKTVKRNTVSVALAWPGALIIGLVGNFGVGRRVLGRVFDVDPDDIDPARP